MEAEYQGVLKRGIAYIIDNIVLFSIFGVAHVFISGAWIGHPPNMEELEVLAYRENTTRSLVAALNKKLTEVKTRNPSDVWYS
ncbi:hypothetical protein [Thermococcus aciditolerans]|uniref:Uncharacterized protein n=1 Tax=Thermococcus aciditolerans TaxID=2598455 RepID=A0A5C0SLW1_9EURY|nr:hypothetical protein [Thermococcus aciditolerans]QEK15381.1 hypothetical protein FPV09_10075 [Thermococcus aciditolerans]